MGSLRFVCRLTLTSPPCSMASTSGFQLSPWSSVPGPCNGFSSPASSGSPLVGDRSRPDGALNADDLAPQPHLARAAEIEAQSGELPMAVLGFLGDRATEIHGGDTAREHQDSILILDHRCPFCPRSGYVLGMNADPRAALAILAASLERHLEASASRRGENDPTVVAAYQAVADAFDLYDDALLEAYGEVTPLEIYSGDDDEDGEEDDEEDDEELDDHGDEDGDDSGVYLGLDDSDYDEEASRTK